MLLLFKWQILLNLLLPKFHELGGIKNKDTQLKPPQAFCNRIFNQLDEGIVFKQEDCCQCPIEKMGVHFYDI